jgi:hypothetical protein
MNNLTEGSKVINSVFKNFFFSTKILGQKIRFGVKKKLSGDNIFYLGKKIIFLGQKLFIWGKNNCYLWGKFFSFSGEK